MALFPTAVLNSIKTSINNIIIDTTVSTLIKYRQNTGSTSQYNVEQQNWGSSSIYTDWSGVSAFMGLFTDTEVGGNIEIGDTKFVFMVSSVSDEVTTADVIVQSGTTYSVVEVRADPLGIAYIMAGRTV